MTGIVILNYNTFKETVRLVEALQRQTIASDLYVVVVDNGSPNGSFEQLLPLESRFERVRVLQSGENLGYAKGNNFGLKYLEEHIGPEYVAILNNDIELPDDCFEKLVEKYWQLDNPCIISPLQLTPWGEVNVLGRIPRFWGDLFWLLLPSETFQNNNKMRLIDDAGKDAMRVEQITGSFMFASLERFRRVGYFYPNTFLYLEERFVGYRVKQEKMNNYLLLNETYMHRQSTTIKSVYSILDRYRMLYDGLQEYTRTYRTFPRLKLWIVRPLVQLSLLEVRIVWWIKSCKKQTG